MGFYIGTSALTRAGRADLTAMCEGNSRQLAASLSAIARMHGATHADEVEEARAALGPERFEQLAAEGTTMAPEEFNARMVAEIDALLDQAGRPSHP